MSLKNVFPALIAAAAALCVTGAAHAQIKIGVVSSSSGPIALVGIPQKNTVALLPKEVAGQKIEYFSLDDASDPTASVSAVKKLINEDKVDAFIGPSGSPNAMGVIQFAAEAGVPMFAPVGTAAVVLPMTEQKKWVFKTTQNDDLIANALVDHMKATGIKSVSLIGTADPYGENWAKVMTGLLSAAGTEHARALLVCVNDKDAASHIVALAKKAFPLVPVLARAYDRQHAIDLIREGVDWQVRETFESAMLFGSEALRQLGVSEGDITELAEDVRRRDAERLQLQMAGGIDQGRDLMHGSRWTATPLTKPRRAGGALNDAAAAALEAKLTGGKQDSDGSTGPVP